MVVLTAFMIMIIALALAFSSLNSHQAALYQNRGGGCFFIWMVVWKKLWPSLIEIIYTLVVQLVLALLHA